MRISTLFAVSSLSPLSLCLVQALAFTLLLGTSQAAQARPEIRYINGKPVEVVEPYTHRRKLYIETTDPDVVDLRRRKPADDQYLIQVPPMSEAAPGRQIILQPQSNGLTPSGFGSNIPKGGFAKPALAPVRQGGLAPLDAGNIKLAKTPPRGAGLAASSKEIKTTVGARPVGSPLADYGKYSTVSGASGTSQITKPTVVGRMATPKSNRYLLGKD